MSDQAEGSPESIKQGVPSSNPDNEVVRDAVQADTLAEGDLILEEPSDVATVAATESPEATEAPIPRPKVFKQETAFSAPEPGWDEGIEIVSFPAAMRRDADRAIDLAPNISMVDSDKDMEWAETLNTGMRNHSHGDAYTGTVEREDGDFRQGVKSGESHLMGGSPRFRSAENEVLSGARAAIRFQDFMGMGTVYQFPCWHSGIWITVKAPSEGALLELQRVMNADKIQLGRASYGLVFSNISAYSLDRMTSFVLSHLYETTVDKPGDMKTLLKSHDIPAIIHGLACAIYPRGFQYQRACVANPEKCHHVVKERLNLPKLLWVDTRQLTAGQVAHMSKRRANSMTIESVKAYQSELLQIQNRDIVLGQGSSREVKVTLRMPTLAEYIDSGSRWVNDIVEMVNGALGVEVGDAERNAYIMKQGQASSVRQYGHWVESLDFGSNTIDDRKTLEGILDTMSSDDLARDEFMAKVKDYIDDSCIALVGIPVYDCPKCGGTQPTGLPKQTSIIPIDIYQTFFTLLVQKLQRLTAR